MTVIMKDKSCFWIFEAIPRFIFLNIPIKIIYKRCLISASLTAAEPQILALNLYKN